MNFVPVAEVYRGKNVNGALLDPRVESVHFGVYAVLDANDNLVMSGGNVQHKTFIRSAAKPIQMLPFLASGGVEGFGLSPKECAIICASHNGEPIHVEAARGILNKIGLSENDLQ